MVLFAGMAGVTAAKQKQRDAEEAGAVELSAQGSRDSPSPEFEEQAHEMRGGGGGRESPPSPSVQAMGEAGLAAPV